MKKQIIFSLAVLLAGYFFVHPANAQMMQQKQGSGMMGGMMQGMMGGQGMHGGMMQKMHSGFSFYLNLAKQLDLTDEQIKKLRDMKFAFEKDNIQRKSALETAQLELQQLKAAENIDAGKVAAKIREVQNRKADLEVALFQAEQNAKSILTDEQKAKIKSMACAMCGQMHEGGMMGGMMQGMMGGQSGMMQKGQSQKGASEHEQHHKKN